MLLLDLRYSLDFVFRIPGRQYTVQYARPARKPDRTHTQNLFPGKNRDCTYISHLFLLREDFPFHCPLDLAIHSDARRVITWQKQQQPPFLYAANVPAGPSPGRRRSPPQTWTSATASSASSCQAHQSWHGCASRGLACPSPGRATVVSSV